MSKVFSPVALLALLLLAACQRGEDSSAPRADQTSTPPAAPKNLPPETADDQLTLDEDSTGVVDVLANDRDPEGRPLSLVRATAGSQGDTAIEAGQLRYTPRPNAHGEDRVRYVAADPLGAEQEAWVNLTITPINDPPLALDDSGNTAEDSQIELAVLVNDSDADGEALNLLDVTASLAGASVSVQGDRIVYLPPADFSGTDRFAYRIRDAAGVSSSATVEMTVTAVNDAPVALADSFSLPAAANQLLDVLANDRDVEDGSPVLDAVGAASSGASVSIEGGRIRYTTANGFSGVDRFSYTVADAQGLESTAQVQVLVASTNAPPIAIEDGFALQSGKSLSGNVLNNDRDPEGRPLSVQTVEAVSLGTLNLRPDGSFDYTAAPETRTAASFRYRAFDGEQVSEPVTVRFNISPPRNRIVAIAHRGLSTIAPENTLSAYQQAIQSQAEWSETDVQFTKDKALVLMHDTNLARTTDVETKFPGRAPYNVRDFTLAEIQTLDAGSWFFPAYTGEKVPTLRQLLDLLKGRQGLVLEIKSPSLYPGIEQAIAAELDAAGWVQNGNASERLVIQAFDWNSMKRFKDLRPALSFAILHGSMPNDSQLASIRTYALDANLSNTAINAANAAKLRGPFGLGINPYTVDDPNRTRELLALPIDGIITNSVVQVLSLRNEPE